MADHEIKVIINAAGQPVPLIPPGGIMRVNDTVRYTCDEGEVRIVFELPFSDVSDVILEGETRKLTRAGNFFCKCFLTRPDNTEVGWTPDKPEAGGEHDVRP
jgi:hypothetical protein